MAEPQSDGSLGGLAPGQQGPAALAPRRGEAEGDEDYTLPYLASRSPLSRAQ